MQKQFDKTREHNDRSEGPSCCPWTDGTEGVTNVPISLNGCHLVWCCHVQQRLLLFVNTLRTYFSESAALLPPPLSQKTVFGFLMAPFISPQDHLSRFSSTVLNVRSRSLQLLSIISMSAVDIRWLMDSFSNLWGGTLAVAPRSLMRSIIFIIQRVVNWCTCVFFHFLCY